MTDDRDCKNCIHRVPILDEDNFWSSADCDSWDCEFVSRKEALQVWKDRGIQYTEGYQDGFAEAKRLYGSVKDESKE